MTVDPFQPFASEDMAPPGSDEWAAKRRVADALRSMTEVLVTSTPSADSLNSLADQLLAQVDALSRSQRLYGRMAFFRAGDQGGYGQVSHESNPLSGYSNPIAPPLVSWIDGDTARGKVTLGWAYEGPPETVHGGVVAAVFDHFLGLAQVMGQKPGMTGTLKVSYHQRTPLNTELQLRARVRRTEGRKTWVRGEMAAGDTLTASCEGLFIQPSAGYQKFSQR